jgi:hypothetical protein
MADDNQDGNELDAETRRGLRILADSTKAKGSEGAARRLYKAADTGNAADYVQAEALFDSLPPEKRSSIQSTAETKATTVRETQIRRKKVKEKPPEAAEFIEWELSDPADTAGIFQMRPPEPEKHPTAAAPPPPPKAAPAGSPARPTSRRADPGQNWELNRLPAASRNVESDDDANNWDWQKLPDDPAARKKPSAPKNELDALRQEMLKTLKD